MDGGSTVWYVSAVRLALALVLTAGVLVGCGGNDDDVSGDAAGQVAAVVRSDDGRAELTLPEGADAAGVTVSVAEAPGGGLAYELEPSGRTFDGAPATLTISDVEPPHPTAIPIAFVESDDGAIELVDLDIDREHVDGVTTETLSLDVPHFSIAVIAWEIGEMEAPQERPLGVAIVELAGPSAVPPKVDFGVRSRVEPQITGFTLQRSEPRRVVYDIQFPEVRARGTLTVTNAAPTTFDRMPAQSAIRELNPINSVATMQCLEPGFVGFAHEVHIAYDFVQRVPEERRGTVSTRVRSRGRIPCREGQATTTSTLPVTRLKPIVTEIRVELQAPVTTYTVVATDPTPGRDLIYMWGVSGERCGTPLVPFSRDTASFTWSHADAPPDSCAHTGTDHAIEIKLMVFSSTGGRVSCTVRGSNSQVLTKSACV